MLPHEVHILSGGIDSVSVLFRRLSETQNHVHVIHLNGVNSVPDEADQWASRNVVVWLARNVRAATYSELSIQNKLAGTCRSSVFSFTGLAVGIYVVSNPWVTLAVQGTNGGSLDQSEASLQRNKYREGVCAAVCSGYADPPTWLYPNNNISKAEAYALMPPELRDLCMSCIRPIKDGDAWRRCGMCEKCQEIAVCEEAL